MRRIKMLYKRIEEEKTQEEQIEKFKMLNKMGFCKLYCKTVFQMRSVYACDDVEVVVGSLQEEGC